jgi:hypothetical protein
MTRQFLEMSTQRRSSRPFLCGDAVLNSSFAHEQQTETA